MESLKVFSSSIGEGKYTVTGYLTYTQEGIVVQLFGGEHTHVGTVVLSRPRSSGPDKEKTSATSSVLNLLHHRDDLVARPVGEKLARELN